MKILHVVPGLNDCNNGIAVAAKLIVAAQSKSGAEVEVVDTQDFVKSNNQAVEQFSEVWVHSMWMPMTLKACWQVLSSNRLVRMPHGNLDPVRLKYHGWKKRLVGPIERFFLRRATKVWATCEAERQWILAYEPRAKVELTDVKRFFNLFNFPALQTSKPLNLLYLGRRHPLKGVGYLTQAVGELAEVGGRSRTVELRIVSDHFGEELERDWEWCEVLVLPTLSENFGLVVAEALERGKRVITTDGAPAWEPGGGEPWCSRLVYLRGFRDGTAAERVALLKSAIERMCYNNGHETAE